VRPLSGPFGPLERADAPITRAQHAAHKAERRAADRLPSRPQLLAPPPIQTVRQARQYVRAQGGRLKAIGVHEGHVPRSGPNRNADPFHAIYENSDAHDRLVLDHYRAVLKALDSHDQGRLLGGVVRQLRDAPAGRGPHAVQAREGEIAQRLMLGLSGVGNPRAVAGKPHHRLHLPGATVDLTTLGYHVRNELAGNPAAAFLQGTAALGTEAAQHLRAVHASNKHFYGRALNGLIDTPVLTIPSLAGAVSGLARYAAGAPGGKEQANEILHGFTDPFVHPAKSFSKYPIQTLLAWRGAQAAVGRGAGALTRDGIGSTVRPDLRVYDAPAMRSALEGSPAARAHGEPIYVPRTYSGDVFEKGLQKVLESVRTRRGQDPHAARGARARAILYGGSEAGHSLAQRGLIPKGLVGRTKPGLVDQFAGDWEILRRFTAQQHVSHFRALGDQVDKVLGKGASDAIPLFAEGVLTDPHIGGPLADQIHAEIARLADAQAFGQHSMRDMHGGVELEGEHAAANAANIQTLHQLLENDRLLEHPEPAIAAAHQYVQFSSEMEGELARLGGILPEQVRAKLFPVAQKHGGAVTSVEANHRLAAAKAMHEFYAEKAASLPEGSPEHADAVAQRDLMRHEVRVWGRHHVEDAHAIEQARAEMQAAKIDLRDASAHHARSGRKRSEQIGAQRVRRGQAMQEPKPLEGVSGQSEARPEDVTWFHGTTAKFEGLPHVAGETAHADLGLYLTSDAKLAGRYAGEPGTHTEGLEGGRVVMAHVEPKKVLDIRFGRHDVQAITGVLETMRERARVLEERSIDANDPKSPAWKAGGDARSAGKKLEKAIAGMRAAKNVEEWKAAEASMYDGSLDLTRAVDIANGAHARPKLSERALAEAMLNAGFDAVRKVDDGADALVVLDQRILRPAYSRRRPKVGPRAEKAKAGQRKVDQATATADEAGTIRQQAEKAYKEAKDRHEEAKKFAEARAITGLRKDDGTPWTTQELEELAHEVTGGRGVGYLGHDLPNDWRSSVFSRTSSRPGIARFRRSGEAFRTGAYARSFDTLLHQVYDTANRISGHRRANSLASRFGVGRFDSEDAAKAAADQINGSQEAAGMTFEPHLIGPDQTLGIADPVTAETMVPEGTPAAFRETNLEGPKWTLLPDAVARRVGEHDKLASRDPGLLDWYTNRWRNASLFTSPRWFLGNPQEYAIRLGIADVSPLALAARGRAARVGGSAIEEWKSAAADESLPASQREAARANIAMYEAGTHYGSLAANIVREDELPWAHTATAPKVLVGAWLKWKNEILGPAMKRMEHGQLQGLIGREALRETSGFARMWGKLTEEQDAAIKAWARGKLDPNQSAELGQRIMRAAGNWTHLTPATRRAVQGLTPFGLWWINSLRFVYGTLPLHHPFKVAIIAALEIGQHKRLEAQGQGTGSEGEPHLQGGIHVNAPIVGGVTVHPTYYSPFGIATEPGKTAIDMIGPQFSDPALTTIGINPLTFQPRTTLDADGQKRATTFWENLLSAINALGEGATPLARQAHQLIDQGATPLGTNTLPSEVLALAHAGHKQVKPDTQRGMLSTLAKILSPVRYFYDPRTAGGASFGSGGSIGGGSSGGSSLTPAQQAEIDRAASAAAQGITPAEQRELDRVAGVSP
jgi:hypothetical protein